ncbi:hypothetical protein Tco_0873930 [Tanacetum coccineum]|uniref:Uncharacterized protein n=1 Tax=Tanacetum coccineum TaxID=301880 RepID=A0ABQ5BPD0_9ASTR
MSEWVNSTEQSCRRLKKELSVEPLEVSYDFVWTVSVESVNRRSTACVVIIGTEFKNQLMYEFLCQERNRGENYSIARTHNKMVLQKERIGLSLKLLELSQRFLEIYNRVIRKVQDCLHVNFLEYRRIQKGRKGPDWMFDLEPSNSSMNYIPVGKKTMLFKRARNISVIVEDLDDSNSWFIQAQLCIQRNVLLCKRSFIVSDEQALHDELIYWNTPTDSDDDIPKDGIFSTNSFDVRKMKVGLKRARRTTSIQATRGHAVFYDDLPEGIEKEEVWIMMSVCTVPELKAIRLFLGIAFFHGLHCSLRMECQCEFFLANHRRVSVKQPPGFEDPVTPTSLQSWQGTLWPCIKPLRHGMKTFHFLLNMDIGAGAIDKTCLLERNRRDIMVGYRRDQLRGVNYLKEWNEDSFLACKKQTLWHISSTEAEYVAAASCCAQYFGCKINYLIMDLTS